MISSLIEEFDLTLSSFFVDAMSKKMMNDGVKRLKGDRQR